MTLASYPQGIQRQRLGRAKAVSIPAPTGGWNTRDSLDEMDPTDAVVLDNFIPEIGKVAARQGYEDFIASGIGSDDVETLMTLVSGSTEYFLAATDNKLYEINTGSAVDRTGALTITSDRWQYAVFSDASSSNAPVILAVNGTDSPWTYAGGGAATAWTFNENGAATTEEDFVWINVFKNRVFMGRADSRNFSYGRLGQVPGTTTGTDDLVEFPLSGIRGAQGNILFMASMTRDTGSGPDDFAVFVTTEGQAIVYAGTDPGDASAWSIVGVYEIPRPIQSRRGYAPLMGDVAIATELDYVFLSDVIQRSGALLLNPTKLTGAMRDAAAVNKENYGWELVTFEQGNVMLSNIPRETNASYHQHVINLQTRAASRFTGWDMRTFGKFNGQLYGGGNGKVYRLLNRLSDDASDTESPICLSAQTAWTSLRNADIKWVRAVRPLIRSQSEFRYGAALGVDFVDPQVVTVASRGPQGASTRWGDTPGVTTYWGDRAATETFWAGAATASLASARDWRLISGRGTDFCFSLASDIKDQAVEWLSTDYKVNLVGRY